jgi:hypothetical protein
MSIIDQLRNIALRFQIDTDKTIGHSAKVETVISVLGKINQSFNNFLEVEFLKDNDFNEKYNENPQVLNIIKDDLDLLVVDLKFSSFEAALAPNIIGIPSPIFNDKVNDFKSNVFNEYLEVVVYPDYSNPTYLEKVINRYSVEERTKIFQPFFNVAGTKNTYTLNFKNSDGKIIKSLYQPEKPVLGILTPKSKKENLEQDYKTFQLYVKAKKRDGKFDFKKSDINKFLYYEEVEHETYPYTPSLIKYDGYIYDLKEKLKCDVSFEDGLYIINNKELDIYVWGDNRDEAEEAFNFTFHATYENFALEDDIKLSEEAIQLKNTILQLVANIYNEK